MKVVFMGTPDFAAQSLNALLQSRHTVLAVVTVPDKPQGRGQTLRPSPVKVLAMENNLPVLQPSSLKDPHFINQLNSYRADVFVVVAFRILPPQVFTIPPKGTVNIHASLLPRYRGAAPINWAIINGDTKTGVTSMIIDEKVDTGNILLQAETEITPHMNAGELHDILARLGAKILIQTLDGLENNSLKPRRQDDALASKAPKINKEFCHISFNQPVEKAHNLIRGLSPYPAAFCYHNQRMLKLFKSMPVEGKPSEQPATISEVGKDYFHVACADGYLRITEVQLQGKKRMPVRDFLNGYTLRAGDLLT